MPPSRPGWSVPAPIETVILRAGDEVSEAMDAFTADLEQLARWLEE